MNCIIARFWKRSILPIADIGEGPGSETVSSRALTELLRGKGAHADPLACVEDLSADLTAHRVEGFPHSIRDLVFHMNYWMDYELRRIRGERPAYPEHNSVSFPSGSCLQSSQDWDRLRNNFAGMLNDLAALANSSSDEMHRQIDSSHAGDTKLAGTLEAVLWQMVTHNSYHIGQIAMMRRMLNAWPPRDGGDTW
jgi:uncharacterized damage-inducible protein DinB